MYCLTVITPAAKVKAAIIQCAIHRKIYPLFSRWCILALQYQQHRAETARKMPKVMVKMARGTASW